MYVGLLIFFFTTYNFEYQGLKSLGPPLGNGTGADSRKSIAVSCSSYAESTVPDVESSSIDHKPRLVQKQYPTDEYGGWGMGDISSIPSPETPDYPFLCWNIPVLAHEG